MVRKRLELSKEFLDNLYTNERMSIREIAKKVGGSKGQIEYLLELYGIPKRSFSESHKVKHNRRVEKEQREEVEALKKRIKGFKINTTFSPAVKRNMLIPVPIDNKCRDASVTLVMSDAHVGDVGHLPKCFWSSFTNAMEVIKNINSFYKIKKLNLLINGDVVSGVNIYRYQELSNLVQRGNWQVALAEIIIRDMLKELEKYKKIDDIVFVRGTHEKFGNNFILYLKRIMSGNTIYLSHGGVYDLGLKPYKHHTLFMHGYGFNNSSPVSSRMINDVMKIVNNYKNMGMNVNRVCSAHSHWLSSGLIINDIYWDTTGGFQKWAYTINQRPCGMIVYLCAGDECLSIPVRPNSDVELEEKFDPGLKYRNLVYYGNYLLKHLKEVEGIEQNEYS